MSKRHTYRVAATRTARLQAERERIVRQLAAERLRAEIRAQQRRAEAERLHRQGQRESAARQAQAAQAAEKAADQLARLRDQEMAISQDLADLTVELAESSAATAGVRAELSGTMGEIAQGLDDLDHETAALRASWHQGTDAEAEVAALGTDAATVVAEMGVAEREGHEAARELTDKIAQLQELEAELALLSQSKELAVPVAMTLAAMKQNGYRVRAAMSEEGLVSYFESEDRSHRLAVLTQRVEDAGEFADDWRMVVETQGQRGDDCHRTLEDFEAETAMTGGLELFLEDQQLHTFPRRPGDGIAQLEDARPQRGQDWEWSVSVTPRRRERA